MDRKPAALIVALLALLGLAIAFVVPAAGSPAGAGGDLYLLQARSGTLSGSKLVLHGVDPRVISFADRPERSSSSLSEQRFARDWGKIFGGDPPNAALTVEGAPASRDVALVELRDPRYDAGHQTLTYSVRRLRQTGDSALAGFDRRGDGNTVKRFGRSSLFIDNGLGEAYAVTLEVKVPAGAAVTITFSDTEFELSRDGIDFTGIETAVGPDGKTTGTIAVDRQAAEFAASGPSGSLQLQATLILTELRGESLDLTGAASVPSGARLVLTPATTQVRHSLATGPFTIPLE